MDKITNSTLPKILFILLVLLTGVKSDAAQNVTVLREPSWGETMFYFSLSICAVLISVSIAMAMQKCIVIFDKRSKQTVRLFETIGGEYVRAYIKYQKIHLFLGFVQLGMSLVTSLIPLFVKSVGGAFSQRFNPQPQAFEAKRKGSLVGTLADIAKVALCLIGVLSAVTFFTTGETPFWIKRTKEALKDFTFIGKASEYCEFAWTSVVRLFKPCDFFCMCICCQAEFDADLDTLLTYETNYALSVSPNQTAPKITRANATIRNVYHAMHCYAHHKQDVDNCDLKTFDNCRLHYQFLHRCLQEHPGTFDDIDDEFQRALHAAHCDNFCSGLLTCEAFYPVYWKFVKSVVNPQTMKCPVCKKSSIKKGICAYCANAIGVCIRCKAKPQVEGYLTCDGCDPIQASCPECKELPCVCLHQKGKEKVEESAPVPFDGSKSISVKEILSSITPSTVTPPVNPSPDPLPVSTSPLPVNRIKSRMIVDDSDWELETETGLKPGERRAYIESGPPLVQGEWRCCNDFIYPVDDTYGNHRNACKSTRCEVWLTTDEIAERRSIDRATFEGSKDRIDWFDVKVKCPERAITGVRQNTKKDTPKVLSLKKDITAKKDIAKQAILPKDFFLKLVEWIFPKTPDGTIPPKTWKQWCTDLYDHAFSLVINHPLASAGVFTLLVSVPLATAVYYFKQSHSAPTVNPDLFSPLFKETMIMETSRRLLSVGGNQYNIYSADDATIADPNGTGRIRVNSSAFKQYVDSFFSQTQAKSLDLPSDKGHVKIVRISRETRVKCNNCGARNLEGFQCKCSYSVKRSVLRSVKRFTKEAKLADSEVFSHYDRIIPRVFNVLVKVGDKLEFRNNAFLWGSRMITTKHGFTSGEVIVFSSANNTFETRFDNHHSTSHKDLIYFDLQVPSRIDPVNLKSPKINQQVMLVAYRKENNYSSPSPSIGRVITPDNENILMAYSCSSEFGSCGAPVLSSDNSVVGIHAAGEPGVCNFFIPFTPALISDLKQNF